MRNLILASSVALMTAGGGAFAQTAAGDSVRVAPGQVCAQNKCMRFSPDLQSVSIQGRRPASVAALNLNSNPVISLETFREIFFLALRQGGVNGNRG